MTASKALRVRAGFANLLPVLALVGTVVLSAVAVSVLVYRGRAGLGAGRSGLRVAPALLCGVSGRRVAERGGH